MKQKVNISQETNDLKINLETPLPETPLPETPIENESTMIKTNETPMITDFENKLDDAFETEVTTTTTSYKE